MATLSAALHAKAATIKPSKAYPQGRFPINDANHARAALMDLKGAKGLSSGQKAAIASKARAKLAGTSGPAKRSSNRTSFKAKMRTSSQSPAHTGLMQANTKAC